MLKILNEAPPSVETYDDFSHKFSQSFRDMVRLCLQKDPTARPTAKELLKHKFFSKHGKDSSIIIDEIIKKHPKLVCLLCCIILILDRIRHFEAFCSMRQVKR